ncbi:hypothetical protein E4K65_43965 [Bradyrhizobium niftali]|uniref:Uncharacterized protein n=1 Tax=Bradyrhizobium niftali TaxID=2560055 RepID=A0A4Y9L3T2_9BRAD|nr:hypothetical protein E4K65_43965 [Bradyrhizobium niftali]
MTRVTLGKSRVLERRMPGSVRAKSNGELLGHCGQPQFRRRSMPNASAEWMLSKTGQRLR